jgi:hypothetical protein
MQGIIGCGHNLRQDRGIFLSKRRAVVRQARLQFIDPGT